MSEAKQIQPYQSAIKKAEAKFAKVAGESVDYEKECIFAMQMLMKNDYSIKIANQNPQSVHLAMINVASTGLTLNPANGYAYLVPRDGAIVLDVAYKGLIKIATDSGSVLWARADLVFESDSFTYHGPAAMPEHKADVFRKDRGEIVGAYCVAKTRDGDILTEIMPRDEIEKIRDKSQAWIQKKQGPWAEWFEQMAKKAVIKRASKTWPYTDRQQRLLDAIELANDSEGGYDLEHEPQRMVSEKQVAVLMQLIVENGTDLQALLEQYDIESLEALPASRFIEVRETIKEQARAAA